MCRLTDKLIIKSLYWETRNDLQADYFLLYHVWRTSYIDNAFGTNWTEWKLERSI